MNLKKNILLLTLLPLLAIAAQGRTISYKNVQLVKNPTELKRALTRGGAKYLDVQEGTAYFQDHYAGLPCMLQYDWTTFPDSQMTLSVTFEPQDSWAQLDADYDKVYSTLERAYGEPNEQTYSFLHSGFGEELDRLEELRQGRCDYFARWHRPDGIVVVELATSATGECFTLMTIIAL